MNKSTITKDTIITKVFALVLFFVVSSFSDSVFAYSFSKDGIYYNIQADNKVFVTSETSTFNSYSGDVVIPATVNYNDTTYIVTGIETNAFRNCAALTCITLPQSSFFDTIENYAFFNCSQLKKVNIPSSVKVIGSHVFEGCTNLSSVVLPTNEHFTSLSTNLFASCTSLKSINIPESIIYFATYVFQNCTQLKTINIGSNEIKTFNSNIFNGCNALQTILIKKNLTATSSIRTSIDTYKHYIIEYSKGLENEDISLDNEGNIILGQGITLYKSSNYTKTLPNIAFKYTLNAGMWNLIASPYAGTYTLCDYFGVYDNTYSGTQGKEVGALLPSYNWISNNSNINSSSNWLLATNNLTPMQGYLAYVWGSGSVEVVEQKPAQPFEFSTSPSFTLTDLHPMQQENSTTYWYALGNPYINSALSVNAFVNRNSNIVTSSDKVQILQNDGSFATGTDVEYISRGQGFVVETANAANSFSFDTTANKSYQQTAKESITSTAENARIKIQVSNSQYTKSAYLSINPNATNGYDNFDAHFLKGFNDDIVQPYFPTDQEELCVNTIKSLPYTSYLNLSTRSSGGDVEISFMNIPEDIEVIFSDYDSNYIVTDNFTYNTYVVKGENANRFSITLKHSLNLDATSVDDNNISIWSDGKDIHLQGKNLQGIEIFNALGKKVYGRGISGNSFSQTLNLNDGLYIVKVKSFTSSKSSKIIIKE